MAKDKSDLETLVELFKKADPNLHDKPVDYYLVMLERDFSKIRPEAVQYAIEVCLQKEYYKTKHISYFKAIALNQNKQLEKEIKAEERRLGTVPKKFV